MQSAHHIVGNTVIFTPGHTPTITVVPAPGVIVRGNTFINSPNVERDRDRDQAEAE